MDSNKRWHERDPTIGFGRCSAQGNCGRGNGRGYLPQGPLDRNERYNQAGDWSDPANAGRRRNIIYFPTAQSIPQRNIPPPVPALSEDRFFTDWNSNRLRLCKEHHFTEYSHRRNPDNSWSGRCI